MNRYVLLATTMLYFAIFTSAGFGDQQHERKPHPEDYPVTEKYDGKPAKVDLTSDPDARRFKTRLIAGIREGVNFAGQYTIVNWGCGTNCTQSAILETKTGKVSGWFNSCGDESYSPDSTLLVINPEAGDSNQYPEGCYTEYYHWTGTSLERINTSR